MRRNLLAFLMMAGLCAATPAAAASSLDMPGVPRSLLDDNNDASAPISAPAEPAPAGALRLDLGIGDPAASSLVVPAPIGQEPDPDFPKPPARR
jgi:hypothetical protein